MFLFLTRIPFLVPSLVTDKQRMNPSGAESENPDLVAKWRIALPNGLQTIEFEHGETSGKRVVRLNGEEVRICESNLSVFNSFSINQIIRKDWMFSLIGSESFKVGGKSVVINIYADGFLFNYKLTVDGKPIESFVREMNKLTRTWFPTVNGKPHRVVIGEL